MDYDRSGWQQLMNRFYRKLELYEMHWTLDMNMFRFFPAPFGGPVAVIRDDSKLTMVSGNMKPLIQVFTSTGTLISSFLWEKPRIVDIGWTKQGMSLFFSFFSFFLFLFLIFLLKNKKT